MSAMTSLMDFRIITVSEAEQRFGVSVDVQHPYQDLASEQEIHLYQGGLSVEGTMEPESDDDWVRYNVIVDGDLTGTGDIAWWDSASGNSRWSPETYGSGMWCCRAVRVCPGNSRRSASRSTVSSEIRLSSGSEFFGERLWAENEES